MGGEDDLGAATVGRGILETAPRACRRSPGGRLESSSSTTMMPPSSNTASSSGIKPSQVRVPSDSSPSSRGRGSPATSCRSLSLRPPRPGPGASSTTSHALDPQVREHEHRQGQIAMLRAVIASGRATVVLTPRWRFVEHVNKEVVPAVMRPPKAWAVQASLLAQECSRPEANEVDVAQPTRHTVDFPR